MRVELSLDALSPLLELVQAAEHAQTAPRNPEGEVDSAPEVMACAYLMNGSRPSSHMSEMYQSRTIHRAVLRPCEESEWAHVCKKTAMPFTDVALHRIKSANWASSYPLQSSCVMLSSLMDHNGQHDQQWSELQSTIRQEVVQSLNLPTSPVPSSWHQRVEAANHLTSSLLCGPTLMRCTTICVNNPTSNPTAPAHSSARCEAAISVPFRFQLLPLLSGLWPTAFGPTANTREAFLQLPLFKDCEAGAHESLEAVEGVRSDGCGSTSLKALGVELEALGVLPIDDCHDIVKALVGVHALLRMDPHTASEADRVAEGLLSWEGDSTSLREALCTSTDAIHGEETLLDALRNVVAYLLLSSLFTHLDEVMTAATTDLGHRQSTPSTSHTRVVHMVDLRMPQEASCTDSWGATFQAVHKTFLDAFVEGVKEHLEGEYTAEGIPIATNSGDGAASPTAELNEYLVRLWPMRSQEDRSPLWEAGLQVAARFRNPALCRYPEQERSPTASALLERSLFEVASFASSIAAMLRDVARTDAHVLMHHPTEEEDCAGCTLIPRLHAHPSVHLSYPQMAEWLLPLVESPQSVIDLEMGPWMTHDPHALRETYEEAMRAGRFRLAVEQVMPAIPRELSGECGASEAFLTCAAVQRWLQLRAHVHTTHATLIQRIGRAYMGRRQIISGAHPAALSTIIANGREDETARREMLRQHATTVRDVGRLQLIPHLQSAVPRVQNEWRNNMTLMVGELRSALEDIHTAEAERLRVEQRAEEVASAELRAVRAALSERPSRVPPSMKQPTPRRNHHQTSAASAGRTPRQLFERSPSAAHHTTSGLPSEEERRVRTEAQRIRQAQWAALDARDQQDRALQRQASEASERHRISQHLEHQERTRWPHSHVVATPITRRSPSQQHGEVVPTHTVTRARSLTPLSEEASAAAHHRMTQWTAQRDLVSMWESSVMSTL